LIDYLLISIYSDMVLYFNIKNLTIVRSAARSFLRLFRNRFFARFFLVWRSASHIVLAPPDLRMIDAHIAREFCEGRYPLGGTSVDIGTLSPFVVLNPNPQWAANMHSFRWLRHMRPPAPAHAVEHARFLVRDWIARHGTHVEGVAWDFDTLSKRTIAWMQHSGILLRNCDIAFYRLFLKSLSRQLRYLRLFVASCDDNETKLRCIIALNFAALSLPVSSKQLSKAIVRLEHALKHQILPDGMHISRNPETIIELLTDLLPLRQTFTTQSMEPPLILISAIERMMPALRFFRHCDGALANFNGAGYSLQERMASVMRYDDAGGKPLSYLPHSGYQRLSQGSVTLIADTGALPPLDVRDRVHAGCLSFEMSSGRCRYIVNSGTYNYGPDEWHIVSRTTAAHSTATINDRSSCQFSAKSPFVFGLAHVVVKRVVETAFSASHDGYAALYQLKHSRTIEMTHDGSVINGIDRFLAVGNSQGKENDTKIATLRFHVHPNVSVSKGAFGHIVMQAERGDTWVFTCSESLPEIEGSLFFAGISGPQKTKMIVLKIDVKHIQSVNWRMTRTELGQWS
jgi:uncharacterized heparinase superfamily protein